MSQFQPPFRTRAKACTQHYPHPVLTPRAAEAVWDGLSLHELCDLGQVY